MSNDLTQAGEGDMKKIDFESHFVTEEWVDAFYRNKGYPRFVDDEGGTARRLYYTADVSEPWGDPLLNNLLEVGEKRLEHMDAAGVDVQVLSLSAPGAEHFDPAVGSPLAERSNDALAAFIAKYPDRFIGYAALAPRDPETAASELERSVKELGFKGWKTHCNYGDSYLDEKKYWPVLAKAEELDVPIYLHPAVPMIPQLRTYGFAMAGAPFGFGIETSMVMMRLIFSGAFDAFPNLKVILGHLGEGLPFILERINFAYVRPNFEADPGVRPKLAKKPGDYIKEHMFVSTSGNYLNPAFFCTRDALGIDRIVLATDYPYESSTECMDFLEDLPLSRREREAIYSRNAARLGVRI